MERGTDSQHCVSPEWLPLNLLLLVVTLLNFQWLLNIRVPYQLTLWLGCACIPTVLRGTHGLCDFENHY